MFTYSIFVPEVETPIIYILTCHRHVFALATTLRVKHRTGCDDNEVYDNDN